MEYFSVGSLSHFRILLLPIGSISRTTFEQWAAEIRTLETLRLSDIPPGTKDDKGKHAPPRPYTPLLSPLLAQRDLCQAPNLRVICTYASRPTPHLGRITAYLSSDHLFSRLELSALQAVHRRIHSPLSSRNLTLR